MMFKIEQLTFSFEQTIEKMWHKYEADAGVNEKQQASSFAIEPTKREHKYHDDWE